jgi:hypothetical protein
VSDEPLSGWRLLLAWTAAAVVGWLVLGAVAWALYWAVGVVFGSRL